MMAKEILNLKFVNIENVTNVFVSFRMSLITQSPYRNKIIDLTKSRIYQRFVIFISCTKEDFGKRRGQKEIRIMYYI
jgi:hypothetical protein